MTFYETKEEQKRHREIINSIIKDRTINFDTVWNRRVKKKKKLEKKKIKKNNSRLFKGGIIRDIRTLFEQREEDYYKQKNSNFSNKSYIGYESNSGRIGNLSPDENFSKIETYLRDIITDLQISVTWKIQLTIAINLISSRDSE